MQHIIKVNHTQSYHNNLKSPIRIILMSDLHFGFNTDVNKIKRAFKLAGNFMPDYICLAGDNLDSVNVIDNPDKRQEFIDLMRFSGLIAPTMVGLADHDVRYYDSDENSLIAYRSEFWSEVDNISNVHVLDNTAYEDERIRILGYTMPSYYYVSKYNLPLYSKCRSDREDESLPVLIEDIERHRELFISSSSKFSSVIIHSPQHIQDATINSYLLPYQHIYAGHMHNGCVPPILDDVIKNDKGVISPQRTLFPNNARGVIEIGNGRICIISGGITKIHESAKAVLRPFNGLFPMHMDVIDAVNKPIEEKGKIKELKLNSYYKYVK